VNAISKRICDILSPEDAFGDSKTISIYDGHQKEVVVWFEAGQRRSTSIPEKPIQSVWACQVYWYFFFDHDTVPLRALTLTLSRVTAVTVRRLFVFVTGRCSTIQYCTII